MDDVASAWRGRTWGEPRPGEQTQTVGGHSAAYSHRVRVTTAGAFVSGSPIATSPITTRENPYAPINGAAITDMMDMFDFHHFDRR